MATNTPAPTTSHRYTAELAGELETRWQAWWAEHETFRQPGPGEAGFDASKPKFYALDMFPYPSGSGLHVGHPEGYTGTDIVSRAKRMQGFNVLHPMGWDAFGLPAEQYAIQTGVHPEKTTAAAIETFRRQLQRFGFSYDWTREFGTIDTDYYKWTQWIFLKLYHSWFDPWARKARPIDELMHELEQGITRISPTGELVREGAQRKLEAVAGESVNVDWSELSPAHRREVIDTCRLAYVSEQVVNWCPKLGTALANEEVIDGKSERGGYPVSRKPLRQWMLRITSYAERLLEGLHDLDWPASTKTQQAEWIGKSQGAAVFFALDVEGTDPNVDADVPQMLEVFTTRPDTLFGATFMVVAPEHELVEAVLANPRPETPVDELRAYVETARTRSEVERQEAKEKTGVRTGINAINPANGKKIPVFAADYVLAGYGTGAIMAVPGQDQRDWDFAIKYSCAIVRTVKPPSRFDGEAFVGDGPAINSEFLNGMSVPEAKAAMTDWLEEHGHGVAQTNYKLRDWLFSRQRYWGEPFPIVYDEAGNHHAVGMDTLPVELPPLDDFAPEESDDPQPMLAKAREWVTTTAGEAGVDDLPADAVVRRETNTMPNWAGSCWYYLRYCDPKNVKRPASHEAERYWLEDGVNLYIGGAEHAVLHLLYARFWHMVLYDLGEVSTPEPFRRLFHQGLILSHAYQRGDGSLVPVTDVSEHESGGHVETATGKMVTQTIAKMSKSLRNVINPDDVIEQFGADTFRLYEMYMGPLESAKPWNTDDTIGMFRFLRDVWKLAIDEQTGRFAPASDADDEVEKLVHRTIAKVTDDIDALRFNTAIAAMVELKNRAQKGGGLTADQWSRLVRILAPFAPHIAEELWNRMGETAPVSLATWPGYDEAMLVDDEVEIVVQINGKVKGKVRAPTNAEAEQLEALARADGTIEKAIAGKTVRKVVAVPGRLVNIVVG